MPLVAVTLLTALSGLYIRLSESWGLLYKCNLFFHPLIGLLWVFGIYWEYVSKRTRTKGREQRLLKEMFVIFSAGIIVSTFTTSVVGLVSSVVLCAVLVARELFGRKREYILQLPLRTGAIRVLFFYGVLVASATGILIILVHGGASPRLLFTLHATSGVGVVLLLAFLAFLISLRNPAAPWELLSTGTGLAIKSRIREVLSLGVVGFLAIILWTIDPKEEVHYTFHLSTVPLDRRTSSEVDEIPKNFAYAPLMASVDACGRSPGCHKGIVDDHKRSSHNRSIRTSYFQKNLGFMAEEIGEQNTYICTGCHFPNAYFLSGTGYRDFADKDAYSCMYCHTVDDVVFTEDKSKTILKLKPNIKHLKMFAPSDTSDNLGYLNELMIRLNPQGHRRVFRKSLYFQEEYCQVCHHLQIKPSENAGFMKVKCIGCHMQPRKWIGEEGKERNHFFPGTNLAGPIDLNDWDAVRTNSMYSRGEFDLTLRGWGGIWSLIPKEERKIKDIWLLVSIEPMSDPVPGKALQYRIVTTNTSLDHAFPAAPLDLIEVWLETWVKDGQGRVIFQSGVLTEDHKIPQNTHKLGGYMIGMDDHLVTKNRVWQIKEKVLEREIRVNEQVQDTFSFTVPKDVGSAPLEIYASWNYRKLNQEFVNWAYPHRSMTVPVLRIAEAHHRIDLPGETRPYALKGAVLPSE